MTADLHRAHVGGLFRLSVISGLTDLVERHLRKGADVNGKDVRGDTPLILAASLGYVDICELLLREGADRMILNDRGQTAFDAAIAHGQHSTASLLAERSVAGFNSATGPGTRAEDDDSWQPDVWEVEAEASLPPDDQTFLRTALAQQATLSGYTPRDLGADWSDVEIELPQVRARDPARARPREGRPGARQPLTPKARPVPNLSAMDGLDLTRTADELLGSTTLAQVISPAQASIPLKRAASRSPFFDVSVAEFLADDDAERRFLKIPGLELADCLELSELMNAFTVLMHSLAGRHGNADLEIRTPLDADPQSVRPAKRRPEEVLAATRLSQVILSSDASATLRQALRKSDQFRMSVSDFLQENDGEAIFTGDVGLPLRAYFELSDLVNEFTSRIYDEAMS